MKRLSLVIFIFSTFLFLNSPVLAREKVSTTNQIESPPEAPSNYVFKNPDAKAKASTGDLFREVSGKLQAIFKKYDDGKIDEAEAARLIKTEISPLLPDREYEIALQLSELKARAGQ